MIAIILKRWWISRVIVEMLLDKKAQVRSISHPQRCFKLILFGGLRFAFSVFVRNSNSNLIVPMRTWVHSNSWFVVCSAGSSRHINWSLEFFDQKKLRSRSLRGKQAKKIKASDPAPFFTISKTELWSRKLCRSSWSFGQPTFLKVATTATSATTTMTTTSTTTTTTSTTMTTTTTAAATSAGHLKTIRWTTKEELLIFQKMMREKRNDRCCDFWLTLHLTERTFAAMVVAVADALSSLRFDPRLRFLCGRTLWQCWANRHRMPRSICNVYDLQRKPNRCIATMYKPALLVAVGNYVACRFS